MNGVFGVALDLTSDKLVGISLGCHTVKLLWGNHGVDMGT